MSDHMISSFRITEDNTILFSASYSGIDNIFKTNLDNSNNIEQITSAKIGAYDPIYDTQNNIVYYCDYTDMGAKVSKITMDKSLNTEVIIKPLKQTTHTKWTTNKQEQDITSFDFQASNKKTKYRPIKNGMKLHSWGVMYLQESFNLGIEAKNILSNISASAGYSFKESQNKGQIFGSLTYGKYAVKSSIRTEILGGALLNMYEDSVRNVRSSIDIYSPIQWRGSNNENSLNVGAEVINNNYSYYGLNDAHENLNISESADFNALSLHLDFSKVRDKKKINLQPKWGLTFASKFRLNLNETKMRQVSIKSKIYLPGFFANDGFFVDFGYEHTRNDLWERFDRTFEEAKGYQSILISDMATGELKNTYKYKGSYNYQTPLCYPDFGVAGVVYIKRIFADGFADFQQVRSEDFKRHIHSYGFGIHLDINLLNDYPIQIGLRQCYVSDPEFSIFKGESNPLLFSLKLLYL
ncbi:hypothetical protein K4L44_06330 [Halosquirtibacter laminarini]|uniref:Uncharacterized protein n=1 Tax=Halosquirtibacter laminarini TaxID=3374600 RepID=A0AC61NID1_9BACT|nr:hypothetical protein K4L44_06330 [Prolixibacteraceae bacterium]